MSEQFKQEPKNKSIEIPFEEIPNEAPLWRDIRRLDWEIDEAEIALKVEDREKAKEYLPKVYDDLIKLNKRDKKDWQTLWIWNPDGYLSEEVFIPALRLIWKGDSKNIAIKSAGIIPARIKLKKFYTRKNIRQEARR